MSSLSELCVMIADEAVAAKIESKKILNIFLFFRILFRKYAFWLNFFKRYYSRLF